ncbi:MAG TPA: hypothetical protein VFD29_02270 [Gillisia sp.]|nr:hypothetical protein [Gillisia sp.]
MFKIFLVVENMDSINRAVTIVLKDLGTAQLPPGRTFLPESAGSEISSCSVQPMSKAGSAQKKPPLDYETIEEMKNQVKKLQDIIYGEQGFVRSKLHKNFLLSPGTHLSGLCLKDS